MGIAMIAVIFLGGYSYGRAREYLNEKAEESFVSFVGQITGNLDLKLNIYEKSIEFILNDSKFPSIINKKDSDPFEKYMDLMVTLRPLLNNTKSLTNEMTGFTIYSDNEAINDRVVEVQPLEKIRNKSWFQDTIYNPQINWIIEDNILVGVYGMRKLFKNAPTNIVAATFDFNHVISTETRDTVIYDFAIFDAKGNVIFPSVPKMILSAEEKGKILKQMLKQPYKLMHNGSEYMVVSNIMGKTGWRVCYIVPCDRLIAEDNGTVILTTLLVIIVCFLLLLILTRYLSAAFVRKIKRLNHCMKQVEDGNLKIRITADDSKDEIGQLTDRFAKMLTNINRLIEEVYHSKLVQREVELKALRAQINPHFLYNTLSLINSMAIFQNTENISLVATSMADYYRTMLNKGEVTTSVKDEITNVRSYLQIQLISHNNSFDAVYDIDEEILEEMCISMMLQPLAENAFKHGIEPNINVRGKITVAAAYRDGNLIFTVEDNGVGMPEETASKVLTSESKGYGVKSVQERIRLYYGTPYGIFIRSSLGKGTRVEITIPGCKKQEAFTSPTID